MSHQVVFTEKNSQKFFDLDFQGFYKNLEGGCAGEKENDLEYFSHDFPGSRCHHFENWTYFEKFRKW